ncbi:hypothetical protein AALO_G00283490 [Alosa alosa]|uniref:Uncharacterized protein n=1 Tax=Alosa alosa TaxID=278164 RepID=A0AAV6FNT6_9TELE|nr:hypothetical protein AALO_G00283490 [Alosa alosa]
MVQAQIGAGDFNPQSSEPPELPSIAAPNEFTPVYSSLQEALFTSADFRPVVPKLRTATSFWVAPQNTSVEYSIRPAWEYDIVKL